MPCTLVEVHAETEMHVHKDTHAKLCSCLAGPTSHLKMTRAPAFFSFYMLGGGGGDKREKI